MSGELNPLTHNNTATVSRRSGREPMRLAIVATTLTSVAMLGAWTLFSRHIHFQARPEKQLVQAANAESAPTELRGKVALTYVLAHAKELVQTWTPLKFVGELAPYDPSGPAPVGQIVDPAFGELEKSACQSNAVWKRAQGFRNLMGEVPNAVATYYGPVLYEQVREQGEWNRSAFIGVRVRDHACGAFDAGGPKALVDGDGDVLAVIAAAAAIRTVDQQADRSVLPPSARSTAIAAVDGALPVQPEAKPQRAGGETTVYTASAFRTLVADKSKQQVIAMLGSPVAVNDGFEAGTQVYDYSPSETYLGRVGFRVTDDVTGQVHRFVMIEFSATGAVDGVSF